MAVGVGGAAAAYLNAAKAAGKPGMEARDTGGGFADMVREAARDTVDKLKAGEQASVAAAAGKADLMDVVRVVNEAEVTLQATVAVRDRVVQAYQEVMRMPI